MSDFIIFLEDSGQQNLKQGTGFESLNCSLNLERVKLQYNLIWYPYVIDSIFDILWHSSIETYDRHKYSERLEEGCIT